METYTPAQQIINWVQTHLKALIILGLILLVGWFISRYGIVNVKIAEAEGLAIHLNEAGEQKQKLRRGVNILPRGSYIISAAAGESQTNTSTSVGLLSFQTKSIELKPQQEAKKVAGNSAGCIAGSAPSSSSVNSFECSGVAKLYKHTFADRPEKSLVRKTPFNKPVPYLSGALAFYGKPQGGIGVVYLSGDQEQKVNFETIPKTDVQSLELMPFTGSSTKFVVIDRDKNQLSLFNSVADTSPKTTAFPQNGSMSVYYFGATENKLYVVGAEAGTEDKGNDAHAAPGELHSYAVSDAGLQPEKTIALPDALDLFGFRVLQNGYLIATSPGGDTNVYAMSGDALAAHDTLFGVTTSRVIDNRFVYSNDNTIFSYNPEEKTAYLVHRVDESLIFGTLQSINGGVAFNVNAGKVIHNFVLQDSARTSHREKILNLVDENIAGYVDYKDGVVYAELSLQLFTSDHQNGRIVYDKQEIAEKKSALMSALASAGVNFNETRVITSPE